MNYKQNCWEFMSCGREPGGAMSRELGICPASIELRLDNVHAGSNAGRSCWIVAGTMCSGRIQGTFAKKFRDCVKCNFYHKVLTEEYPHIHVSALLLAKLHNTNPKSTGAGAFPVREVPYVCQGPNTE